MSVKLYLTASHPVWYACRSVSPEAVGSEDWKLIQKNVFTRWCNERLKVVSLVVEELQTDLSDGVRLVALVQVLSQKKVGRYNKKPRVRAQKIARLNAYVTSWPMDLPFYSHGCYQLLPDVPITVLSSQPITNEKPVVHDLHIPVAVSLT